MILIVVAMHAIAPDQEKIRYGIEKVPCALMASVAPPVLVARVIYEEEVDEYLMCRGDEQQRNTNARQGCPKEGQAVQWTEGTACLRPDG